MERVEVERWEGVAFSCVLSVLCALALTKSNIGPGTGIVYWLIFIILCGLSIDPERYPSFGKIFAYCLIPSATLVATATFRALLKITVTASAHAATHASHVTNPTPEIDAISVGPVLATTLAVVGISILYVLVLLATALAITMGSLSRRIFLGLATTIWKTNPTKLKTLEKNIFAAIRIAGILLGVFLAFR